LTIPLEERTLTVRLVVDTDFREESLLRLALEVPGKDLKVRLGEIATLEPSEEPAEIIRIDGRRAILLRLSVEKDKVDEARRNVEKIRKTLPKNVEVKLLSER
jgi:multidrug efflux pump subunit AcrB